MAEFTTIVDDQGRSWTGLVVQRRPHSWTYLMGLVLTGGLAGASFREPDTVTVRLLGQEHCGREQRA